MRTDAGAIFSYYALVLRQPSNKLGWHIARSSSRDPNCLSLLEPQLRLWKLNRYCGSPRRIRLRMGWAIATDGMRPCDSRSQARGEEDDMLILTRRIGETVMVGDDVSITVLGVKGNQVRLGINAPKSIAVHREEIYERIKNEGTSRVEPSTIHSDRTSSASKEF